MSSTLTQIRNVIFTSVKKAAKSSTAADEGAEKARPIANIATIKQVSEEIMEVIQQNTNCGANLKLRDVEQAINDANEEKNAIIAECISRIFNLHKTKSKEEVKAEVVNALSRIHESVKIARVVKMTDEQIRKSFVNGLTDLLQQISNEKAFPFERILRSKDITSFKQLTRFNLSRTDALCALAAKSIINIILAEDNAVLNEMINSFINENGLLTTGVAVEILLQYLSNENLIEISSKIQQEFVNLALADEKILRFACLTAYKQEEVQTKHLTEYIKLMFIKIVSNEDERINTSNSYVEIAIRSTLFNSSFLVNEEIEICFDLKTRLEGFLNKNSDLNILLKNMFASLLKEKNIILQDDLLESTFSVFLTTIIYSNAALNGILDRDSLKNMTRNEIIKQICAYTANKTIDYSKEFSDLYTFIQCALFVRDKNLLKQENHDDLTLKIVDNTKAFQLLLGPDKESYRDLILRVIERFNEHVSTIPSIPEGVVEVTATDSQLKLMLMMALSREAESFIKQHQSQVEIDFLNQYHPEESLTKTEQALKRFLVPSFLSVLAIVLNNHFSVKDDCFFEDEQDSELRLRFYLERNFQLNNCLEFSEQNILDQIQKLLINRSIFSKLRTHISQNKELFCKTLSNQLTKALKDSNLNEISKSCLERTLYISRNQLEAKMLAEIFLFYIFSDLAKESDLYPEDFHAKPSILKLQNQLILKPQILCIFDEKSMIDLKMIFKGCLNRRQEFEKIRQDSQKRTRITKLRFTDFDSQIISNVKIPNEPARYLPMLIVAFMVRLWATNKGLTNLQEINELKNIPNIADIICHDIDKNEILSSIKDLIISCSDRDLFSLCFDLYNFSESRQTSVTEIEQSILFSILTLREANQLSQYVFNICDDLRKSARTFSQQQAAKQSKLDRQQHAAQERQREKLKQKQKEAEKELRRLDSFLAMELSATHENFIQNEPALNSSESSSESEDLAETISDESRSTQSSDSPDSSITIEESFAVADESTQQIDPHAVDSTKDRQLELLSKTVAEIAYTGQAEALDEISEEFGALSEREQQMLSRFFSKIQDKVCKPIYEKGQLEGSSTVVNPAELVGAEAVNIGYEVIIPRSFKKWLNKLNSKTREDINKRLDQIASFGNFGHVRSVHHKQIGAFELKFADPYGTRVYYIVNNKIVYILCGGDKNDQDEVITSRLKALVGDVKLREGF